MLILGRPRSTAGSCLVETARHGNRMMAMQAMVDPCCFRGHCRVPPWVVIVGPEDSMRWELIGNKSRRSSRSAGWLLAKCRMMGKGSCVIDSDLWLTPPRSRAHRQFVAGDWVSAVQLAFREARRSGTRLFQRLSWSVSADESSLSCLPSKCQMPES